MFWSEREVLEVYFRERCFIPRDQWVVLLARKRKEDARKMLMTMFHVRQSMICMRERLSDLFMKEGLAVVTVTLEQQDWRWWYQTMMTVHTCSSKFVLFLPLLILSRESLKRKLKKWRRGMKVREEILRDDHEFTHALISLQTSCGFSPLY